MPLFPIIDLEAIVQENDKTRLDASKSYASGDITAITKIEIQPDAAEDFYDVTETGYLDWQYEFDATPVGGVVPETNTHAVTVRVTAIDPLDDQAEITKTLTKNITIISEVADMLFASDDMLRKHEADISKYISDGRASFKDVHRRVQTLILAWLDEESFVDDVGNPVTVKSLSRITELRDWATAMALRLIFEGVSTANDDIFTTKASRYRGLENMFRDRATIHIKPTGMVDEGGLLDTALDVRTCRVYRR